MFSCTKSTGNPQDEAEAIRKIFRIYEELTTGMVKEILKMNNIHLSEDTVRRKLKWLVEQGELDETEVITKVGRRPGYKLRTRSKVGFTFTIKNPKIREFVSDGRIATLHIEGDELKGTIQTRDSYVQIASATVSASGDIVLSNILTPMGTTSVIIRSTVYGGPYCPKCGTPLLENGDCPKCPDG